MNIKDFIIPTNRNQFHINPKHKDLVIHQHSSFAVPSTDWVNLNGAMSSTTDYVVRPEMCLKIEDIINARKNNPSKFIIGRRGDNSVIVLGEYPTTLVRKDKEFVDKKIASEQMVPTGKKYVAKVDVNGKVIYADEYKWLGNRYVKIQPILSKATIEKYGLDLNTEEVLVHVEPIKWIIKNWDQMPKSINFQGTGEAEYMEVIAEKGLMCLPYSLSHGVKSYEEWENSIIRSYLNGTPLKNYEEFEKNNFFTEAFDMKPEIKVQANTRKRKGYGVVVQEKPMTINEQIEFYIKTGKTIMLHGMSGVGKSRRVEEIDPDYTSIKLYDSMLPEEVKGKTNFSAEGSKWQPPAWYIELCEKCEREPEKNHVLFIDELTNVDSHEQKLVFHIILERCVDPHSGKLPKNAVVIAAGNSPEESDAAYNMTEALFRRFTAHVYIPLDLQNWLEWGSELNLKRSGTTKIHPLVSAFVATYANKVFYTKYDIDNPPKYVIDPRGWEQVSDIIYDNDGLIAQELLENKVGPEITASFIAFAKNPPLALEDIIENNYDVMDIPEKFDARYALALSLRNATEEELPVVRDFVNKYLGKEILSTFDTAWANNDPERAMIINDLQQEDKEVVQQEMSTTQQTKKILTLPKKNYDITVDEFWLNREDYNGIRCWEEWQAKILMKVFAKMGQRWNDGAFYDKEEPCWDYGNMTVYTNYSNICEVSDYDLDNVYAFNRVDLTKYLDQEDINTILKHTIKEQALTLPNVNYHITVEDFFDESKFKIGYAGIVCKEKWQAEILTKVFNKMGKTKINGKPYGPIDNFDSNNVYLNDGDFEDYYYHVSQGYLYKDEDFFDFNEVDLTKYLDEKDILTILQHENKDNEEWEA